MSQPEDPPGRGRGNISPDERDAIRQRASELGQKIEGVRARSAPASGDTSRGDSYGQAFRMSVELVAGVAVGGGIGWFLDGAFGTRPWLLIVFFFLGFAGGLLNIVRSAQRMQREAAPRQRAAASVKDDDTDDR